MFDKTTNNTTNNYINSENAMMVKTQEDSFMVHCKLGTYEAMMLFNDPATWKDSWDNYIDVVVLQTLYCWDGYVICEVVPKVKGKMYESEEEEKMATKNAIESYINRH